MSNTVQEQIIEKSAMEAVSHLQMWQVTEIAVQVMTHYLIGKNIIASKAEKPDGFDAVMQMIEHTLACADYKPSLKPINIKQDSL